jgi:uncharacterized protein (DUF1800 family)
MRFHTLVPHLGIAAALVLPAQANQAAREQTADQQVRHALNRLAFGARPGDYERVRGMGVDAWITQQLDPGKIPDPAVERLLVQLPMYSMSIDKLIEVAPQPTPQERAAMDRALANAKTQADTAAVRRENQQNQPREFRSILPELQSLRLARAVASERQLEEVMVDFWLNHFSVFAQKNAQMRYFLAHYEREVIRPRAFGRFRDLVEAVAKSPAMLVYLDNQQSVADTGRITLATYGGQPDPNRRRAIMGRGTVMGSNMPPQRRGAGLNENYARELLELHTLGVDGGYTQHDVTEVARALTGWSVVRPQEMGMGGRAGARLATATIEGNFMFRAPVHDAEPKTVLGVKLKGGRGIEDGEQVLDIVARHPSTAKHIATKLARRFVSDSPPPALVDRAAQVFQKTDGNIREVVRTIITSPEFFSSAAYRAKVKSPFELVASTLRAVGAPPDLTPRSIQVFQRLDQMPFTRQTPDGWPETGDEWINTGSILSRINFGLEVAAGRLPGANPASWPLPQEIGTFPRERQVDAVVAAFLGGEVSPETRAVLLSGNNPMLDAAPDAPPPPDRAGGMGDMRGGGRGGRQGRGAMAPLPPLEGVPLIVGLALGAPEFQRR